MLYSLMLIFSLFSLSQQDRVIIVSIHQPRYSIYKLFDTLTILSKGDLVYHGLAGNHALQYFNDLGITYIIDITVMYILYLA